MYIDRFKLKNILASKYTAKIINAQIMNAGHIDQLITEIAEDALKFARDEREKRAINVPEHEVSLDELRDSNGRRRYKLACVDDDPVMIPAMDGFWTPIADA